MVLDKVLEVLVSDWLSDIDHEIGLEKQVEDSIDNFQSPLSSDEIADISNDFSVQYGVEEQIIASVDENLSKGFPQPMIEVLENQMSEKLDQLNQYIADL